MAILKQRLMKGKGDGTYDTIHLETTSDLVLHGDKTMSTVVSEMQTAIDGKAASGHTHTPASIGAAATSHSHSNYVPTSRTVNGKALSANISLAASDVGAVPITRKVCGKALSSDITITPNDIGAALADHTHEGMGGRLGAKSYTFEITAILTEVSSSTSYYEVSSAGVKIISGADRILGIDYPIILTVDSSIIQSNLRGSVLAYTALSTNYTVIRHNVYRSSDYSGNPTIINDIGITITFSIVSSKLSIAINANTGSQSISGITGSKAYIKNSYTIAVLG